jgi:hypothetical protein
VMWQSPIMEETAPIRLFDMTDNMMHMKVVHDAVSGTEETTVYLYPEGYRTAYHQQYPMCTTRVFVIVDGNVSISASAYLPAFVYAFSSAIIPALAYARAYAIAYATVSRRSSNR